MGIACDRATVAAAVAAASPGDTITLNAGTATWTSAITIDKQLTIIGAGIGNTVITDHGFTVANGVDDWRISGIEWANASLPALTAPINFGGFESADGCRGLRIDHCRFGGYPTPMFVSGMCTGVIDNCVITGILGDGIRMRGAQELAWAQQITWGTADWLFMEDCDLTNGSGANCMLMIEHGARLVIRYNTFREITSGTGPGSFFDAHGFGHGTAPPTTCRGAQSYELYGNRFVRGRTSWPFGLNLRAGCGVVWSNVFDDNGQSGYFYPHIKLFEYRAAQAAVIGNAYMWAEATLEGVGDARYSGEQYPAVDQIGRGHDLGSDPFTDGQGTKGLYVWDNEEDDATPVGVTVTDDDYNQAYIQLDRDYFTSAPDGYTPYTYPHPLRGETVHRNKMRFF